MLHTIIALRDNGSITEGVVIASRGLGGSLTLKSPLGFEARIAPAEREAFLAGAEVSAYARCDEDAPEMLRLAKA